MSSETYPRAIERRSAGAELKEGDRICLETSHQGVDTRIEVTFKEFNDWGNVVNVEGSTVNVWNDTTFTLLERPKKPLPQPGDAVLVLGSTSHDLEDNLPLVGFVDGVGDLNYTSRRGFLTWIDVDSLTDWRLLTIEGDKVVTHD